MLIASLAAILGLIVLVWSAGIFIEGSATVARHYGMSPLLIGMLIVGCGTSAPEMLVSGMAAAQNSPGIALGNIYGSNIANIALILGVTALLTPITVHSSVVRKELPALVIVTGLAAAQFWDGMYSRLDALLMLAVFVGLVIASIRQDRKLSGDALGADMSRELEEHQLPVKRAFAYVLVGLLLLIASSRLLVWSAVEIAAALGVSDLIIGLTIVAVGTSLPEFASSIIAARKGEHDIALGNIIGSNLFNTLAIGGVAGLIQPLQVPPELLTRDMVVVAGVTVLLFTMSFGFGQEARLGRLKGAILLAIYLAYTAWLINVA
jgi:cation:H+ antiporter